MSDKHNNNSQVFSPNNSSTYQTNLKNDTIEINDNIPIKNENIKKRSHLKLQNRKTHFKIPSLDLTSTLQKNTMIVKYHHDVLEKKYSINNKNSTKSYKRRKNNSYNQISQKNTISTLKPKTTSPLSNQYIMTTTAKETDDAHKKDHERERCNCGCYIF